jgi:hypothetical protein
VLQKALTISAAVVTYQWSRTCFEPCYSSSLPAKEVQDCLSVCLSVCLPVCLSACLSVCLSFSQDMLVPLKTGELTGTA